MASLPEQFILDEADLEALDRLDETRLAPPPAPDADWSEADAWDRHLAALPNDEPIDDDQLDDLPDDNEDRVLRALAIAPPDHVRKGTLAIDQAIASRWLCGRCRRRSCSLIATTSPTGRYAALVECANCGFAEPA